ncbi:MAG: aminotransferase class I/II-fold pyridoxal phosphate-dependent enzyme [Coriobacteriia bacterium]|nr:aminotransferase class I/II-fold pyridoxal phosphate-dependent enzyme [Coriobacteriia bacterium]MBS5478874.1 aminotransferase class I/II-fold pyridoxal phosphate-dependent enzyme [Coriobacteriia bacterium]
MERWQADDRRGSAGIPTAGGTFSPVPVCREGIGSLQRSMTPQPVIDAGFASFGGAEMDFKTVPSVIEAATRLAQGGLYGYTLPTDGYLEAITWWMANARSWDIDPAWIVPAQGTIFSVAAIIRMATDPGDAIITQTPVYYRYEQAATRLGRRTVHNELRLVGDHYEMDFDDLERLMADPANKVLVICNPHNPVGRVWPADDLARVGEMAQATDTIVVSDEIFAEMTFDGHRTTPLVSLPQCQSCGITLTSLGKTFGLTGLNNANAIIADPELRARFTTQRTADHFGSIDPLAYACVKGAYCEEGLAWVRGARDYIAQNRAIVADALERELSPVRLLPTEGTFVGWIEWRGLKLAGEELDRFLTQEALLVLEPGEEYGAGCERFSRINLASTHEQTRAAMERLVAAIGRLRTGDEA